jgi:hypothetical protein
MHNLYDRRLHLDALLFISVPSCLNSCPSPLDITGIPVLPHNFRTPSPLITYPLRPLVVYRLLTVCKDGDISRKPTAALKLCANLWYVYINLYMFFRLGLLLRYFLYIVFFSHIICYVVCLASCFCIFLLFCGLFVSLCWNKACTLINAHWNKLNYY